MEEQKPRRVRKVLPSAPRQTIEVTEEIIRKSTKADSSHCMISDAIRAAIPGATYPGVDIQTIRYTKDGFRYSYLTPRAVQVALIKFDLGDEDITPFTFQLRTGQTTRAGSRAAVKTGKPQPRTPRQQAATKRAMAQSTKGFSTGVDDSVKLVRGSGRNGTIPEIRGGRPAPIAPLAGGEGMHSNIPPSRRRTYGMRAMEKYARPVVEDTSKV